MTAAWLGAPRLSTRAISFIAGLTMLKFLLLATTAEDYLYGRTLADDSFYYLKIAQNLWNLGVFPSFDGVNLTNGFHFLYQMLLALVVPFLPERTADQYRVLLILHGLIFCAGIAFLGPVLRRYFRPFTGFVLLCFIALGGYPTKIVATGMESSLAFMLASAFLYHALVLRSHAALLGALLGMLILARLDVGAIFALVFAATRLHQNGLAHWRGLKALVIVTAVSAAIVLPVVAANYGTFGRLGTISSATKAYAASEEYRLSDGEISFARFAGAAGLASLRYGKEIFVQTLGDCFVLPYVASAGKLPFASDAKHVAKAIKEHWVRSLLVLMPPLLLAFWFTRLGLRSEPSEGQPAPFSEVGPLLLAVPAMHFGIVVAVLGVHGGRWYWMLLVVGIGTLLAIVADRFARCRPPLLFGLAMIGSMGVVTLPSALLMSGAMSQSYSERSPFSARRAAAAYLNRNVAPDVRVGSFNAGLLGYITNNPVVNLDGLANNWELLEARKAGRLRDYVLRQDIRYIVDFGGSPERYLSFLGFSNNEYEVSFRSEETGGFVARLTVYGG